MVKISTFPQITAAPKIRREILDFPFVVRADFVIKTFHQLADCFNFDQNHLKFGSVEVWSFGKVSMKFLELFAKCFSFIKFIPQ